MNKQFSFNINCRYSSASFLFLLSFLIFINYQGNAQEKAQENDWGQKFEQLGSLLPSPNEYRTASGAPGQDYWTQQADYNIELTLDDKKQTITGSELITYHNNSPDVITYLWIQLDQNVRKKDSDGNITSTGSRKNNKLPSISAQKSLIKNTFDGGFKIAKVEDSSGNTLKYIINKTMMRIDLPKPLKTGANFSFRIDWSYLINDRMLMGGRSGYEYFPKDKNYLYTIAQFYPRLAAYTDVTGWQNKQFLGRGEFALTFGDFKVAITLPKDYIVASTGELQNPNDVLTQEQRKRFEKAKKTYDSPVFIVTEKEAIKNEKSKPKTEKSTWSFKAENVRDFAFAASRKFIWDAQAVKLEGTDNVPLAMSFYPKEGNPLWEKESTKAIKNTLEVYSKYTFPYPYPVAISVHAASIGMEYPMICFNFGRPKADGTYLDRIKYRMIGVIIHEIGHNYFPMLVNSDERQWTWMDEGLNTFLQYRTEVEKYKDFPSRRGAAKNIVNYMKGDKMNIRPIMTNSEQIIQFGNNAYGKPATALNILRETIMGPDLFDFAFKQYANRWIYKSPEPADFFRTMEDASAVDLDWFWRGWFYSTDHVDISIENVRLFKIANYTEKAEMLKVDIPSPFEKNTGKIETIKMQISDTPDNYYGEYLNRIDENEVRKTYSDANIYEVTLENKGGLVMPVILEWVYEDGEKEIEKLPAEIWRMNEKRVVKQFLKKKKVKSVNLDVNEETADVDVTNNSFPRKEVTSEFDSYMNKKKK